MVNVSAAAIVHPSCAISLSDGMISHDAISWCDVGSDESLVTLKIVEAAVFWEIGKLKTIKLVDFLVSLQNGEDYKSFLFLPSCTVFHTVLGMWSDLLILATMTSLVADETLNCDDILIGRAVLLDF